MELRPVDSRKWLLVLLMIGLLLRLLVAYLILPESGHAGDIKWYSQWALSVATVGPGEFYARTVVNYPPGYIYILWFIGTISRSLAMMTGQSAQQISTELVKLPPMLLDVGAAFLLYKLVQQWGLPKASARRNAFVAAALYLFNPVALYDSAIWGQTDAMGAFILLLGVFSLTRWPSEVTASLGVIAALLKPQFGVVLIPLVGVVLLRKHLVSPSHPSENPQRSYWARSDGPLRIMTSVIVAGLVFYVLVLPFSLNLSSFMDLMGATAGKYKFLSVNAFNPWALVGSGGNRPLFLAGIDNFSADDIRLLGPLTGVSIGTALLACGFLLGVLRLVWRSDKLSVVLVGAYLCLCFFILPTRVHERYLFPALAFSSLLAALDRKWVWATVILSLGSLMNLHAVLSQVGTENVMRMPFGDFSRSPTGIVLSILFQTSIFVFSFWNLWPSRRRESAQSGSMQWIPKRSNSPVVS